MNQYWLMFHPYRGKRIELTKLAKSELNLLKWVSKYRKDANNKIKGLDISDDLKSNLEIDSQELTDKYIKKVDEMFTLKEGYSHFIAYGLNKIKDIYDSPNYNAKIVAGWVRAFREIVH